MSYDFFLFYNMLWMFLLLLLYKQMHNKSKQVAFQPYYATVVFCLTGRFSFSIDTIFPAFVSALSVVYNPCPPYLSPVASSVAFLLVFILSYFLAVDLPTLFSPKNHNVAHVPTTSSVYSSVFP